MFETNNDEFGEICFELGLGNPRVNMRIACKTVKNVELETDMESSNFKHKSGFQKRKRKE